MNKTIDCFGMLLSPIEPAKEILLSLSWIDRTIGQF